MIAIRLNGDAALDAKLAQFIKNRAGVEKASHERTIRGEDTETVNLRGCLKNAQMVTNERSEARILKLNRVAELMAQFAGSRTNDPRRGY